MILDWSNALDLGQFAVLGGIFYRLGGLTKAHDDFTARLGKLETKA
ncbi:hypothetical protein [Celeribacter baekdonensis]